MKWNLKPLLGSGLCAILPFVSADAWAQSAPPAVRNELQKSDGVYPIDLPTALRLANAQNLDVQIARERVAEAKANHESARTQFLPWLSPGFTYRRHDDLAQTVEGRIIEVHKQSYAPGITIGAEVNFGDAYYKTLAAKQLINASTHALESERQDASLRAAEGYFDLIFAQAAVDVAREAIRISTNHHAQVHQAVEAGLVFKGDELRVQVQTERNQLTLRQSQEQQRLAATRLAQTLHLEPAVELIAENGELVPLQIVDANAPVAEFIQQALGSRPELKETRSSLEIARTRQDSIVRGRWIPTASAQIFAGGLGGDSDISSHRFGGQEDYFVGLSWRIGPGGLFDFTQTRAAESRVKIAELGTAKVQDEISRQVVDAVVRVQSLGEQIKSAESALKVAEQGLRLAQLRREFAVGVVLENIQAEQDLTRARFDYLRIISEYNKAQYALNRAVGKL